MHVGFALAFLHTPLYTYVGYCKYFDNVKVRSRIECRDIRNGCYWEDIATFQDVEMCM